VVADISRYKTFSDTTEFSGDAYEVLNNNYTNSIVTDEGIEWIINTDTKFVQIDLKVTHPAQRQLFDHASTNNARPGDEVVVVPKGTTGNDARTAKEVYIIVRPGAAADSTDATLASYTLSGITSGTLGTPAATWGAVTVPGAITLQTVSPATSVAIVTTTNDSGATVRWAYTPDGITAPIFGTVTPIASIANNGFVYIEVTAEDGATTLIYKIQVTVAP
ncbi:MAG: cadherin-like beta sandwich domain-containing protein, partial [Oscillospiraceae bacterium]|nr:cadherin-like beta sandwich domain-containing protein [Oscillospiraceae bacterium]